MDFEKFKGSKIAKQFEKGKAPMVTSGRLILQPIAAQECTYSSGGAYRFSLMRTVSYSNIYYLNIQTNYINI